MAPDDIAAKIKAAFNKEFVGSDAGMPGDTQAGNANVRCFVANGCFQVFVFIPFDAGEQLQRTRTDERVLVVPNFDQILFSRFAHGMKRRPCASPCGEVRGFQNVRAACGCCEVEFRDLEVRPLRRQAINTSLHLLRIVVFDIVAAHHAVMPIGDVDRVVGSNANVARSKPRIAAFQNHLLCCFETSAVWFEEISAHFLRTSIAVKQGAATERSVLSIANFIPAGRAFFAYQAAEYPRWVETLAWAVSGASEAQRRKLFHDNAVAFYRL